jgi:threonylcarbamoyladenosine tRNA methylthiotransferase MtaB
MKFKTETLGCKMNFVDSERIGNTLKEWGWQYDEKTPDYIIINTCTVTDTADKKSETKAKQSQKNATVIITGCSTRTSAEKWKLKFPNAIICPETKDVLAYCRQLEHQYEPLPEISQSKQDRTRKFIEIQTGCDTYCSYCIIPFARGKSKSRPQDEIIAEIKQAETDGYQEIVITGINLAAWGSSHTRKPEENKFADLLQTILNQTTIPRIRISSIGPEYITEEFFEIYENKRMCDHLHISVQSGCDEILQKMNRGHGTQEIKNIVQKARKKRPHTAFTADIIVGFPGETNEHFQETCDFIQELEFMHVHVFPFSVRSGTLAEKMQNQIPEKMKKRTSPKTPRHIRKTKTKIL